MLHYVLSLTIVNAVQVRQEFAPFNAAVAVAPRPGAKATDAAFDDTAVLQYFKDELPNERAGTKKMSLAETAPGMSLVQSSDEDDDDFGVVFDLRLYPWEIAVFAAIFMTMLLFLCNVFRMCHGLEGGSIEGATKTQKKKDATTKAAMGVSSEGQDTHNPYVQAILEQQKAEADAEHETAIAAVEQIKANVEKEAKEEAGIVAKEDEAAELMALAKGKGQESEELSELSSEASASFEDEDELEVPEIIVPDISTFTNQPRKIYIKEAADGSFTMNIKC